MPTSDSVLPLESFQTFGDLLKYLRRRARLTQRELCIAVGYSEAQISRLEQNLRPPDLAALTALFIPALYLEDEPLIVTRLMELAAQARGETLPQSGMITFSRSVQKEIKESIRTVEDERLNNLPLQLTSFIGREHEMRELKNLLGPENKTRLITLMGSGGCGKTRLALQAAIQIMQVYKHGAWLVELASISNPEHVAQTFIESLGLPEPRDDSPSLALTKFLLAKHILLIVDNSEHVLAETAKLVQEILLTCPRVQVIATSREILNIAGEVRYRVPSLSLSDDADSRSESVQLFADRARTALPTFELTKDNASDVARICRRLDGIPLAIELAAARMTTLSVQQIAARLDNSFHLLTGGGASLRHHQTLDAAIEWSYNLLSESERILLQRLSVFAGGWTLEAAESVASDPSFISEEHVLNLLSQLVNKSLVVVDFQTHGETRYHLLETVREYSHKRLLKSGESGQIGKQHFDFFFDLAQKAENGFMTSEHQAWLKRLDMEQGNLRAALKYGISSKQYENTLQFAGTLFWFWQTLGYISEGRSHLQEIFGAFSDTPPIERPDAITARAKAFWCAGSLAWIQGDLVEASQKLKESARLWRLSGDANQLGLAISLREVGIIAIYQGEVELALSTLGESIGLLKELGSKWDLALAFYNQGLVYETKNEVKTARTKFTESLSLFRGLNEPWGSSVALTGLGRIAGRQEDYEHARSHLEESLELSQSLDDLWSNASAYYLLGEMAYRQKDYESAIDLFGKSITLNKTVGDKAMIGFAVHNLGKIAQLQDQLQKAARLFGAARKLRGDDTNTMSWSLITHADCEKDIASLRESMKKSEFESAWAEGQAMSGDEAIGYALK